MRIAVYGNRLVRTAPPALAPFLDHGGGKAALFMSARAVEAFAELTEGRSLHDVAAVCLSPRIAEEAAALSRFAGVLVSPEPTAQGFVDFVSGRCT
jgi:uroporphyrinogen-III synthase